MPEKRKPMLLLLNQIDACVYQSKGANMLDIRCCWIYMADSPMPDGPDDEPDPPK
jgi:hypothetical protein